MEYKIVCFDDDSCNEFNKVITFNDDTLESVIDSNISTMPVLILTKDTQHILSNVDYYFDKDNKLQWDEFVENMTMSNLLRRYPDLNTEYIFHVTKGNLGGANELVEFVSEMIMQIDKFYIEHPFEVKMCEYL